MLTKLEVVDSNDIIKESTVTNDYSDIVWFKQHYSKLYPDCKIRVSYERDNGKWIEYN